MFKPSSHRLLTDRKQCSIETSEPPAIQSKPNDEKNSTQEHISPKGIVTESRALSSDTAMIPLFRNHVTLNCV